MTGSDGPGSAALPGAAPVPRIPGAMFGVPPSRRASRRGPGAAVGLLLLGLLGSVGPWPGCNTAATPSLPAPNFRAEVGVRFPLRAGELGLVIGRTNYLYVSLGGVGIDRRCLAEPCEEPGYVEIDLEVEDNSRQGAVRLRIDDEGTASGNFSDFEIHSHQVEPAPRDGRIPLVDYVVLLSVGEREPPAPE